MVSISPWPILSSIQTQAIMSQTVLAFNNTMKKTNLTICTLNLLLIPTLWWKNITQEANKEGAHFSPIVNMMKKSMLLFIASEVLFFSSFFWSYFHFAISPSVEMGQTWPPNLIKTFNPINVPLLNTIILVTSGFSVTWAHHLMMEKNMKLSKKMMVLTCTLGFYFTILQLMEYKQAEFSLPDSSFGTVFFIATGFHGLHVLIGTTFLMVNLTMMSKMLLTNNRHTGFELAAWYWHFVDVVWLFLYLLMYWWGK